MEPINYVQTFPEKIKRCTQCQSIFIENNVCESCGFMMDFCPLGKPLGEKSFYYMKDEYWGSLNPIVQNYPKLERKMSRNYRKYQRSLFHRYKKLLDYFYSLKDQNDLEMKLYLIELRDIIRECFQYQISEEMIFNYLERKENNFNVEEGTFIYEQVAKWINLEKSSISKSRVSLVDFIYNSRYFGGIKLANMILSVGLITVMVFIALIYYRYIFSGPEIF